MTAKVCERDDCSGPVYSKGLCRSCYRAHIAENPPIPADVERGRGCRCDSPRPMEVEGGDATICDSCGELLPGGNKLPPSPEGDRHLKIMARMAREMVKLRAEWKAIRGHHDRGSEQLAAGLASGIEGQPPGGRDPAMNDFTPPLTDADELDQVRNQDQRERVARIAKQTHPPARLAFTRKEAAQALGVGLTKFKTEIQPELKMIRRGKTRLVPVDELKRWVAENAEHALPSHGEVAEE